MDPLTTAAPSRSHHPQREANIDLPMKSKYSKPGLLLAIGILLTVSARAQTINWGSEVFSDLTDSNGVTLDDLFVFEIGAFKSGFVPLESNTGEWLDHWQVFDRAAYNPEAGYFTGTTRMKDDGTAASLWMTPGALSFEGLEAFLWIRKGDEPVPGNEWLLARADNWTFPTAAPGCCDNELPVEWSVSDLAAEVPRWGRQGGAQGPGEHSDPGAHTLQTYTFVPEPSVMVLAALAGACGVWRRRR